MALLDQLLSGLTGVSGSPLRGVLMNVLGQGGSQNGGAGGGLGGLLSSFEQAGLGHIAQSWIGNGPINQFHRSSCRRFSARIRCRPCSASRVWRPTTSCRNLASISGA